MSVILREEFADANNWARLAKKHGIRLPLWRLPCTTGGMRRFLKKLNISVTEYLENNNERNLKQFSQKNPDWPLRAWVGLQLELLYAKEFEDDADSFTRTES